MPQLIYHFTHRDNLDMIMSCRSLRCKNMIPDPGVNISHLGIQDRRHNTTVPLPPGGTLHDYVPFYFAPRSPMLYSIKNNRVEGYKGGQLPLIYFVSSIERLNLGGISYVFTDGHPTIGFTRFFNNWTNEFSAIDWPLMKEKYWYDTDSDPDRKRRRQAECLVHQELSLDHIIGVATMNQSVQQWVSSRVEGTPYEHWRVKVQRQWYF